MMLGLINVSEIKGKADHEEDDGRLDGRSTQHIPGLGPKSGLHRSAAHGGPHATIRLGPLHEYHEYQEQRSDDQNEG